MTLPIYPGRSWRLYINSRSTGITVWPDHRHPSMWRIHAAGRVSDIVNLSRAKDAAVTWARPRGLGGTEMARWHYRETPAEAPSIAPDDAAVGEPTPEPIALPSEAVDIEGDR